MNDRLAARTTLEDAKYYAALARQAAKDYDLILFRRHVTTAIAYGRAVTDHLRHECSAIDGFTEWCKPRWLELQRDPLWGFFRTQRNARMHESPLPPVVQLVKVVGIPSAAAMGHPTVSSAADRDTVGPPTEDPRPAEPEPDEATGQGALPERVPRPINDGREDLLLFPDKDRRDRPILSYVDDYLERLEALVSEVESRFGRGPHNTS